MLRAFYKDACNLFLTRSLAHFGAARAHSPCPLPPQVQLHQTGIQLASYMHAYESLHIETGKSHSHERRLKDPLPPKSWSSLNLNLEAGYM